MTLPKKLKPTMFQERAGEKRLDVDPAAVAADAALAFIGRVRSAWTDRSTCPKNMAEARALARPASIEIDERWRPGLDGLERASHVVLITWLQHAPRDLIVQKPRHADRAQGVFSLRSPARPNPLGLHVARLLSLDQEAGLIGLDAIDVLDGTPLVDLKPYYASIDAFPEATVDRP